MLFNEPVPVVGRKTGIQHTLGYTIAEGADDSIRCSGDPSRVCSTPVDIVVRTSGEKRLSNFMLWRTAYSEIMFIEKLWPDMTKDDVTDIIKEYSKRSRRFGG